VVSSASLFDAGADRNRYLYLTPNANSGPMQYGITKFSGSGGGGEWFNGTQMSPGGWHHVAVTLRGGGGSGVASLYLNGVRVGQLTNTSYYPDMIGSLINATNNWIGRSHSPSAPFLNGRVDEVRLYNGDLNAAEIASLAAATPPAAPTALTITAGDAQAILSWAASIGATSYNVKRATVTGGPYSVIAINHAGTSFTNTVLINGVVYEYILSAINAAGESTNSTPVSVRPFSSVPPPLHMEFNGGQIELSWPASHIGWLLQVQTNSLNTGLGTNWSAIASGAATNQFLVPISELNGSVFFRLIHPK
jgi:hypothetical protein